MTTSCSKMFNDNLIFGFTFWASTHTLMVIHSCCCVFCSAHPLAAKHFGQNSLVTAAASKAARYYTSSTTSTLHLIRSRNAPLFFRFKAFYHIFISRTHFRIVHRISVWSCYSFDCVYSVAMGERRKNAHTHTHTHNTFTASRFFFSGSFLLPLLSPYLIAHWIVSFLYVLLISFQHFIVIIASNPYQKSYAYTS